MSRAELAESLWKTRRELRVISMTGYAEFSSNMEKQS